jgi:hypothetical protein
MKARRRTPRFRVHVQSDLNLIYVREDKNEVEDSGGRVGGNS